MQPHTPTFSDSRSENSTSFTNAPRYGRKGVDYSKFRTQVCKYFKMCAPCPFGECCAFSHGEPALSNVRMEDNEMPMPPPYSVAVKAEMLMPPAYPSRFRHDPYSFDGVMFEE